jgi:hypothetical protein
MLCPLFTRNQSQSRDDLLPGLLQSSPRFLGHLAKPFTQVQIRAVQKAKGGHSISGSVNGAGR